MEFQLLSCLALIHKHLLVVSGHIRLVVLELEQPREWDPKENGALMICLWIIWLLHSRVTGQMRERGFATGLALLNVVVACSWLGVNLLSTGLHSYGFTDKAAAGLALFCGSEIAFAAAMYCILWRRDRATIL